MKKIIMIALATLVSANIAAATESQQSELSSAQMQYQSLLKAKNADYNQVKYLQSKLKSAERKLEETQLEVNRLRAELIMREDSQKEYDIKIKEVGERLDKAWQAVHQH